MKYSILFAAFIFNISVNSQEVCNSPEEQSLDLNSISITKCSIKPSKDKKDKKSRQITVNVSARKRFLKRRTLKKKTVSSIHTPNATKISKNLASNTNTIKTNHIATKRNTVVVKHDIEDIKNRLSKEEVRKASRFNQVDNIPLFKSCIDVKKQERMDCFNEEMIKHIQKHFKYPSEAVRNSIQGEVWVRFIIDKDGYIKNIKTLGPENGEILNNEAKRVVTELPHFKPARKEGKPVSVKYGFPINFSLEE
ncbi:energy transducer TonB [Tenacibaculum maritimum]|uniref:energy transducer TonB n=1 Tax=Tenacibaculum maritimum TaxID=107401 RepID=UPI0012E498C4|nr:energy transducer TonB [Tenacibaculum maritimum]MCD9582520.1 energy transducer TonB [Tenacibaculum maritimum]MCD9634691.1 energy transducer TonB [Tenacibaculum maritimum]CAA0219518.1 TonB family protein [Tenacibaculum maritimum]CAA0237891.1 TonB family protein [Tenacibaculum maritimum]